MADRRAQALIVAMLTTLGSAPARADPLTLDGLYRLPVKAAAAAALGPGPEDFVERSPWNGVEQNYVLNSIGHVGMSYFTRPERIAPGVCSVTVGSVTFDSNPAANASADVKRANQSIPWGQRPLRTLRVARQPRYFVAGPAPAVPLLPGAAPAALSAAALAADSCENPVSARRTFEADSPPAAISAVTRLKAVILAARGRSRLAFGLTIVCDDRALACVDARARLAALDPQRLWAVRSVPCAAIPSTAADCLQADVDDPTLTGFGNEYWEVTIATGADGRPQTVRLWNAQPPVA